MGHITTKKQNSVTDRNQGFFENLANYYGQNYRNK